MPRSTQASPGQQSHAASWRWNLFWSIQQHYCRCSSDKNYDEVCWKTSDATSSPPSGHKHTTKIKPVDLWSAIIFIMFLLPSAIRVLACVRVTACYITEGTRVTCQLWQSGLWIVGTFRRSRHLMLTFINKTLFLATLYIISTSSSLQHLLHSVFIFLSNM